MFLVEYSHPETGYGTEEESHIDRKRRPNCILPARQKHLLDAAIATSDVNLPNANQAIVRLAIDDDDFFHSGYFTQIVEILRRYRHKLQSRNELVFGFENIACAYFLMDGSVDVENVKLSKTVTGSKFSCSIGSIPRSPYRIKERFEQYDKVGSLDVEYLLVKDNDIGFSYNRHSQNFSNQSKASHYLKLLSSRRFRTHDEYLAFVTGNVFAIAD